MDVFIAHKVEERQLIWTDLMMRMLDQVYVSLQELT
jgi:hypothetical protein